MDEKIREISEIIGALEKKRLEIEGKPVREDEFADGARISRNVKLVKIFREALSQISSVVAESGIRQ